MDGTSTFVIIYVSVVMTLGLAFIYLGLFYTYKKFVQELDKRDAFKQAEKSEVENAESRN